MYMYINLQHMFDSGGNTPPNYAMSMRKIMVGSPCGTQILQNAKELSTVATLLDIADHIVSVPGKTPVSNSFSG